MKVKVTYIDQYDMMNPKAKIFNVFNWEDLFNKINLSDFNFKQGIIKIEKILSVSADDVIDIED